jgi:uncharacterized protein
VKDPHEVAKVGERIKVRVLEVDLARKRIALSARSAPQAGAGGGGARPSRPDVGRSGGRPDNRPPQQQQRPQQKPAVPAQKAFANNPFATLLKK